MLSDFLGLHCTDFIPLSPMTAFTSIVFVWSDFAEGSSVHFSVMGKVGEWKASYYFSGSKTWIYGRLIIYTRSIRFVEDKEGANGVDFRIFYEDFFELKKETTSVFFAAITVRVRADKYWFSSFTDRGYVFNTIEHFWKEKLFARCVKNFADCSSL